MVDYAVLNDNNNVLNYWLSLCSVRMKERSSSTSFLDLPRSLLSFDSWCKIGPQILRDKNVMLTSRL